MDTYTNPQMLSPKALHEAHLEMAKKYLESKWDGHYYELVPEQYEYDGDNYEEIQEHNRSYYRKLTDEQLSRVCKLMKEAEEPFWYEALSGDTELLELLTSDYDGDYPESIIEIPHQYCDCSLGVMDSKGRMSLYNISVLMPKEDYLKLLVIMMDDRRTTFNDIYRYDIDLYKTIVGILDQEVKSNYEIHKPSYTVVFDEIERDVQTLLGEEDDSEVWYDDEEAYTDKLISLIVHFSEKRMGVWQILQDIDGFNNAVLYNIDAKKVLEALNVNTYHDALILLKDRFYIPHVVTLSPFYKIKEFLDHEKIGYEYLEGREKGA